MASKKKASKKTSKKATRRSAKSAPRATRPDHLRKSSADVRVDGWYSVATRAPVNGVVVGREKRHDDEGFIIKIKLLQPCAAFQKGKKEVVLDVDQILAVDEKYRLREVGQAVGREVFFEPTEEKDIGNGKTVWEFDVYLSDGEAEEDEEEEEDDIAF